MKIIVSGNKFTDIDVAACAFGLHALYKLKNEPSEILISRTFNNSLTESVRLWLPPYSEPKTLPADYEVVVVDLSDPEHIDKRVDQGKVTELFDHHFGYEKIWQDKLGKNCHIEDVGSCTTLIVEKIVSENLLENLPVNILKLMATAIISNTLNLKAQITNQRDRTSLSILTEIAKIDPHWSQKYYEELNAGPLTDPKATLENDTKLQTIGGKTIAMTQMELWLSRPFLEANLNLIKNNLELMVADLWFYTSPSIAEGKNYLFTTSKATQQLLTETIAAVFDPLTGIGETDKPWLRKEIIRELKSHME